MMMKLNRKHVLRSTLGHTIIFEKGVPVGVPDELIGRAVELGAEPVDAKELKKINALRDAEIEDEEASGSATGEARVAAIQTAFEKIIKRNRPADFMASGNVHTAALAEELGYRVEARERDAAAEAYSVKQNEGN